MKALLLAATLLIACVSAYSQEIPKPDPDAWPNLVLVILTGMLTWLGWNQNKTYRTIERAYLSVIPHGITPFLAGQKAIGHVGFKNVGRKPARDVRWTIHVDTSEDRNRFADGFSVGGDLQGNNVIPPGTEMKQGGEYEMSADEVADFEYGRRFIYVWGTASYRDGFGKKRFINFCHRYDHRGMVDRDVPEGPYISTEGMRYHEYGNDAD